MGNLSIDVVALRRMKSVTLASAARISSESPYNSKLQGSGEFSSFKSAIRTTSSSRSFYTRPASLTGLVASRGCEPYTTICVPIASGNGGNREEKDLGMTRIVENSIGSAGLQGSSFVAEAAVGRVECTGRGCRPIFDEDEYTQANTHENHGKRNAAEWVKLVWDSDQNCNTDELEGAEFEELPNGGGALVEDCCESVKKAFEAALEARLLSTCAAGFAWKARGDSRAAEEVYSQALGVLPCDVTDLLASQAHYLWQSEQ